MRLTKEERKALNEEAAQCRRRLAQIRDKLSPRPVSEEAKFVLAAGVPVKGKMDSDHTGKSEGATVNALMRDVRRGIISHPKRGIYAAPVAT
jgi:hypothetical protein